MIVNETRPVAQNSIFSKIYFKIIEWLKRGASVILACNIFESKHF